MRLKAVFPLDAEAEPFDVKVLTPLVIRNPQRGNHSLFGHCHWLTPRLLLPIANANCRGDSCRWNQDNGSRRRGQVRPGSASATHASTATSLPKMALPDTHPLIRPRLLPSETAALG